MHIVRRGFCSLNTQTVGKVGLGVIILSLKSVKAVAGFLPDRDHLEGNHIHLSRLHRGVVISQAKMIVIRLAWKGETRQSLIQVFRVVNDQIISL